MGNLFNCSHRNFASLPLLHSYISPTNVVAFNGHPQQETPFRFDFMRRAMKRTLYLGSYRVAAWGACSKKVKQKDFTQDYGSGTRKTPNNSVAMFFSQPYHRAKELCAVQTLGDTYRRIEVALVGLVVVVVHWDNKYFCFPPLEPPPPRPHQQMTI